MPRFGRYARYAYRNRRRFFRYGRRAYYGYRVARRYYGRYRRRRGRY